MSYHSDGMDRRNRLKLKLTKPLVFIGMMGVGKTTLGRHVSARLSVPFYDSDTVIQARAGMNIPDIFDRYGEKKFRIAEHNAITGILDDGEICVLATGGGAVCNPKTMSAIQQRSTSIWLQSDLDSLISRVSKNKNRPLLRADDPKMILMNLMAERAPLYGKADIHYDIDDKPVDMVVTDLIENLYDYFDC